MNNDLEQFSEERLTYLSTTSSIKNGATVQESATLARIALVAKQAKPVRFMAEWSSQHGGMECDYSEVRSEMEDVAAEHDGSVIDFYTTPQPAHTERVIRDGWKLVPEEATLAMLTLLGMTGSFEFMQQKYKNMLAAAPKPESE